MTKIAIPLAQGKLSLHFGHCEEFALIDVDVKTKEIKNRQNVPAPPHQPGMLPTWLAQKGAQMIIAGGMGSRAQDLFRAQGIDVVVGAPCQPPEQLIEDYFSGTLKAGANICDH